MNLYTLTHSRSVFPSKLTSEDGCSIQVYNIRIFINEKRDFLISRSFQEAKKKGKYILNTKYYDPFNT